MRQELEAKQGFSSKRGQEKEAGSDKGKAAGKEELPGPLRVSSGKRGQETALAKVEPDQKESEHQQQTLPREAGSTKIIVRKEAWPYRFILPSSGNRVKSKTRYSAHLVAQLALAGPLTFAGSETSS